MVQTALLCKNRLYHYVTCHHRQSGKTALCHPAGACVTGHLALHPDTSEQPGCARPWRQRHGVCAPGGWSWAFAGNTAPLRRAERACEVLCVGEGRSSGCRENVPDEAAPQAEMGEGTSGPICEWEEETAKNRKAARAPGVVMLC